MTVEESTIRKAMVRSRLEHRKELSENTGIKDQTMRIRFRNPTGLRLYELRSISDNLKLNPAERLSIVDGKEVEECEELLLDWARSRLLA